MNRVEDYIGNKQLYVDINDDLDRIATIAHALSSKLRLEIIHLIGRRSMSINELAQALDVPMSTVSLNVQVLERVGLLLTESQSAVRGVMKLCSRATDRVSMNLVTTSERPRNTGEIEMPIGCYVKAENIKPTCGLAGAGGEIGVMDNPRVFYLPGHFGAQLIWFRQGFLEYQFPTMQLSVVALESIEISFEACSEAVNYRMDYPSDISLEINGKHIGMWTSPGDFGGRRGLFNPDWWSDIATQYGQLVTWRVDDTGSYLNQARVSDVRLEQLGLQDGDHFTLRVGVAPDAHHVGGMNLFGAGFGDYPQHIVLKYAYH